MKHPDRPFLIAITGGIASGKSIVSKWFEEQKFQVIYADKIGHELFNEQYFIDAIENNFEKDITIIGSVDREKLGNLIFNSAFEREKLNKLLHPEILKRMQQIINTSSQEYLIFEIPLLIENNLQNSFDLTINISAKEDLRVKRIMKRNTITKEAAQKRINSQISETDRMKLVDINVTNNSDIKDLIIQLEKFKSVILNSEKKEIIKII